MSPNQNGVYIATSIILFFSTVSVALRAKARRLKNIGIGSDDVTVALSLILEWGLGIVLIVGAAKGTLGTHTEIDPVTQKIIPTAQDVNVSRLGYIIQCIVVVLDGLVKISILLLYRRIFPGKRFRWISNALTAFIAIWTITFFFGSVFRCGSDPAYFWYGPNSFRMKCVAYRDLQVAHAASDVATDILILVVPLPIIARLQMVLVQKLGLFLTFSLGFISVATGLIRLVVVIEDQYDTSLESRDLRGIWTSVAIWGFVEAGVGIIVACLPTFRPLLFGKSTESILKSIRSVLSLRSQGSGARSELGASSGDSKGRSLRDQSMDDEKFRSDRFRYNGNQTLASSANDDESAGKRGTIGHDRILVERKFNVANNYV